MTEPEDEVWKTYFPTAEDDEKHLRFMGQFPEPEPQESKGKTLSELFREANKPYPFGTGGRR